MFHAVRQWWGEGRGKSTARLFAFEFLVVVAGVLVAQALANWVAERGQRAEGERLLDLALETGRGLQRDLNYWQRYGACLREHVATISRAAADGDVLSGEQIGRPALPAPPDLTLSSDDWRKIRDVIPQEQTEALNSVVSTAEGYDSSTGEIAAQWATLRLLDGVNGPPSVADRAQVRLAATRIDNNLRWLMFQGSTGSVDNLREAGLAPNGDLPQSARFVDDCGLLKDWR
jgi:hypothetical protein